MPRPTPITFSPAMMICTPSPPSQPPTQVPSQDCVAAALPPKARLSRTRARKRRKMIIPPCRSPRPSGAVFAPDDVQQFLGRGLCRGTLVGDLAVLDQDDPV